MTFFLTPQNWSEIFLKYFLNISEIFLIIGDPYLLIFLDFCWFLVGMWLLSSFLFVSQPKSGKIRVFPNFQKNQKNQQKQKFIGICRERCVWALPRLVPQIFEKMFFFESSSFRLFHIFSENQTIFRFFQKNQKTSKENHFFRFFMFFHFLSKKSSTFAIQKKTKKTKIEYFHDLALSLRLLFTNPNVPDISSGWYWTYPRLNPKYI